MAKIIDLKALEILDSRGLPSLEVIITDNFFHQAKSSVPAGKSRGRFEAQEKRDGQGKNFQSQRVLKAVKIINGFVNSRLKNFPLQPQKIDEFLIELDGTKNKSHLGANVILAVSLAAWRLKALAQKRELYQYLHQVFFKKELKKIIWPRLFINVINGGIHSASDLSFQEYQIISLPQSPQKTVFAAAEFYQELKKEVFKELGKNSLNVGDEGGLVLINVSDNEKPLKILQKILKGKFKNQFFLGLDLAASQFFSKNFYQLGDKKFKTSQWINYLKNLSQKYHLFSLEDPLEENDFLGFSQLNHFLKSKTLIIGDDLTVTNYFRVQKAIVEKSISTLLLKPNQIGTISEVLKVADLAKKNNLALIVSHRSGETNDDFIVDLALGLEAFGLKIGAPVRGERLAKYNRLLEIQKEIN